MLALGEYRVDGRGRPRWRLPRLTRVRCGGHALAGDLAQVLHRVNLRGAGSLSGRPCRVCTERAARGEGVCLEHVVSVGWSVFGRGVLSCTKRAGRSAGAAGFLHLAPRTMDRLGFEPLQSQVTASERDPSKAGNRGWHTAQGKNAPPVPAEAFRRSQENSMLKQMQGPMYECACKDRHEDCAECKEIGIHECVYCRRLICHCRWRVVDRAWRVRVQRWKKEAAQRKAERETYLLENAEFLEEQRRRSRIYEAAIIPVREMIRNGSTSGKRSTLNKMLAKK